MLVATTPAGCIGRDSTQIYVHPGYFDSLYTLSPTVCPGDSVKLKIGFNTANNNGLVTATYHWTPPVYLSDTATDTPWVKAITNTTYRVIGTSQWGCRDTTFVSVNVLSAGSIFLPDSVTIYPGETYQISPQTNCLYFSWTPAVGLNDTSLSNPLASPYVNTNYKVRAWTEEGCTVYDSIYVAVSPESIVDIPNAFTPGGVVNSKFMIVKRGIVNMKFFRIYDRWGVKVYEWANDNGWDGTYQNKPQPFGVYVYEVEAVTSDGVIFHKKGNVTLLR
jgi:gliding motility-associated-like protein